MTEVIRVIEGSIVTEVRIPVMGAQGPKGDTGDVTPEVSAALAAAQSAASDAQVSATSAVAAASQTASDLLATGAAVVATAADRTASESARAGAEGARDTALASAAAASAAEDAVQDRVSRVPGDIDRFVVGDDSDNLLFEVTPEKVNHPDINAIREQAATGASVANTVATAVGENAVYMVDGAGNILAKITPSKLDHPDVNSIRSAVLAGQGTVARARDPQWDSIRALAEMLHVVSYGQSLSRGHNTIEPVTTTPLDYAYRFVGGARPDDGGSDPAVVYASLVPFMETAVVPYDPGSGLAETPLGGCLRMIAQLLRDEDGIDLVGAGQALLGSAPGAGGKSLAELASGTPYYSRLVDHITYGMTRSGGLGRSYAVSAMLWLQGERDYQIATTQSAYLAALRQLRLDVQASAQAATGFASPLPLVTYQTATHPRLGVSTPSIALAQLEACGDDYIAMASPTYHLSWSATSDVHFDAVGSAWFGAYCGLALKRWLWDGVKPKTLKPLTPMRQGTRIIVPFDVDAGRHLVLDATLGGFANQGFTLVDGGGSPLTISSVALSGPAAVQITAAANVPAGARLRYGWAGEGHIGGGNVRDNAGDGLVFDPGGLSKPLHKWAPICEIEVP